MDRTQYKALYRQYREIGRDSEAYAHTLPCGMQDALYERIAEACEAFCNRYPVIGRVIENRDAGDVLEDRWHYCHNPKGQIIWELYEKRWEV